MIHPPEELLRFILNGRRLPQVEQNVTLRALDELSLVRLGQLRGGAKKDTPAFGLTLGAVRPSTGPSNTAAGSARVRLPGGAL